MRVRILPIVLLSLCGCVDREATSIPLDQSNGVRDGYLARVTRAGQIEWNGQMIDDASFIRYVRQYAALAKGTGRLWLEVEPEAAAKRASFIREQIIASGLCAQQRCVEAAWGAKRPVVN